MTTYYRYGKQIDHAPMWAKAITLVVSISAGLIIGSILSAIVMGAML